MLLIDEAEEYGPGCDASACWGGGMGKADGPGSLIRAVEFGDGIIPGAGDGSGIGSGSNEIGIGIYAVS